MTQAEVIVEAAHTEAANMESLQRILAMEEESKRRAIVTKARPGCIDASAPRAPLLHSSAHTGAV